MSLVFDPGTEKWIPFARLKSKELEARRLDLRLPSMFKTIALDSSTQIQIKRDEFGEHIRITGASGVPTSAFMYSSVFFQSYPTPSGEVGFRNALGGIGGGQTPDPKTPDFKVVTGISLTDTLKPNVTPVRATAIANTCTIQKSGSALLNIAAPKAAAHTKKLVKKLLTAQEGALAAVLISGPNTSFVVIETKNADGGASFASFIAVPCSINAQFSIQSTYTPWPYLETDGTPWVAMVPQRRVAISPDGTNFPGVLSPGATIATLPFGHPLTGNKVVEAYAFLMPLSEYLNAAADETGTPLVAKVGTVLNSGTLTFSGYEGRTYTITYTPFVAASGTGEGAIKETKIRFFATSDAGTSAADGTSETAITGNITGTRSADGTQLIGAAVNYFVGKNVAGARKGIICPSAVVVNWGQSCLGPDWAVLGFAQEPFLDGIPSNIFSSFYYESIPMGSWGIRAFFARPKFGVSFSLADDSRMFQVKFSGQAAVSTALPFLSAEAVVPPVNVAVVGVTRAIKAPELGAIVSVGTDTPVYTSTSDVSNILDGSTWIPNTSLSQVLRNITYQFSLDPVNVGVGAQVPYQAQVFRRYGFAWQRFFADGGVSTLVSYPHHKIQDYDFGTGADSGDGGIQSYKLLAFSNAWWVGIDTTTIAPFDAPASRIIFSTVQRGPSSNGIIPSQGSWNDTANLGFGDRCIIPIEFREFPVFPSDSLITIAGSTTIRKNPMAAVFLPRVELNGTDGFALVRIMDSGPNTTVVPQINMKADFQTAANFIARQALFESLAATVEDPVNNPFTPAYASAIAAFLAAYAAFKVNTFTILKDRGDGVQGLTIDPAKVPLFYPALKAPFQAVYAAYYEVAFNNFASTDVFDLMQQGNVLVLVR